MRQISCSSNGRISRGSTSLSAFTLIELLVVIGVIGILAAILIPLAGQVRTTSKNSKCVSNLRQIVTATLTYASEHKGRLPHPSGTAAAPLYDLTPHAMTVGAYNECLQPYLGDRFQAMYCPAQLSEDNTYNPDYQKANNPYPVPAYFSYQYFNRVDVANAAYKTLFLNLINAPANCAIWGDLAFLNPNGIGLGHYEGRANTTSLRGMNAAYADGSVRWVPFTNMSQFASGFYWPKPTGL
ncbi:MAG: type II secretion system protein [Opitutaceae bacterium]|jgi:general secretion pathway protein G